MCRLGGAEIGNCQRSDSHVAEHNGGVPIKRGLPTVIANAAAARRGSRRFARTFLRLVMFKQNKK